MLKNSHANIQIIQTDDRKLSVFIILTKNQCLSTENHQVMLYKTGQTECFDCANQKLYQLTTL